MERVWTLHYEEISWEDLSLEEREVVLAARHAAEKAYAPYSSFLVGAAARLRNGSLYLGNNQENAAYPSGLCAERVLLFSLGAQGLIPEIETLAVYATLLEEPVTPCGACRQVMYEYQRRSPTPWRLLFGGGLSPRLYRLMGAEGLLPLAFSWRGK
ncbi:MAG: cytidine deaminase [Bacteroidia bacterium]|nr:cytidine deaminase [Bacteroidia bacterium]MDW8089486.1 cytidine deaminase [Bacteroidia bacterium]